MDRLPRRTVLAASALALAGCLDGLTAGSQPESGDSDDAEGDDGGGDGGDDADGTDAPSGGGDLPLADDRLPIEHEFDALREAVISGGPPKDGIPSIDDPSFEAVDSVGDRIPDEEPVFALGRDGDAKAYPQSILVHHEIVNDEVGGEPIAVTYCPLTGTAMGFERGGVEFGVSGRLVNSNLVMYDRETDSRWPQMLATAIEGPHEGASLREVPVRWWRWDEWASAHPDGRVLTEDTGYVRDYDDDPYGSYGPPRAGYYAEDSGPIFDPLADDDRLPPKRMVLGARPPEGPIAIDRERLHEDGLAEIDRDGTAFLAVSHPGAETAVLYRNPDGESFELDGDAVVGPDGDRFDPAELPLDRVYAYDAMWFAWAGFYPSTTLRE